MSTIDRPRSANGMPATGRRLLASSLLRLAVVALLSWGAGLPALSAQADSAAAAEDPAQDPDRPASKSGFDIPTLGGPSSVGRGQCVDPSSAGAVPGGVAEQCRPPEQGQSSSVGRVMSISCQTTDV